MNPIEARETVVLGYSIINGLISISSEEYVKNKEMIRNHTQETNSIAARYPPPLLQLRRP